MTKSKKNVSKTSLEISKDKIEKKPVSKKKVTKKLDLKKIVQADFPEHQYYPQEQKKNQIVLHHTASGRGVSGDIAWWKSDAIHVATCVLIAHDGTIVQCFSSKFWAHHLGVKSAFLKSKGFSDYYNRNILLNQKSVAIEVDNWGGLTQATKTDGAWYSYTGKIIADKDVVIYDTPFRGYKGFERYTDAQIESVRQLLVFWRDRYDISLAYNDDMWDISQRALSGENGVWTHCSFRPDKSDIHPQKEMIEMLKSLS